MFAKRERRRDFLALGLWPYVLLGLSLLSYHRDDPVGEPTFPLNRLYRPTRFPIRPTPTVHNWCGHSGAMVADMLRTTLGWGALLPGRLAGRGRSCPARSGHDPSPRLTADRLAALADRADVADSPCWPRPSWSGPMIGPGGYLGSLGYGLLRLHFAAIGGFLLAVLRGPVRTDPLHRLRDRSSWP